MNIFNHNRSKPLYNPPLLRIFSILSIAYLIYYLWWRVTSTLNPDALAFSWLLWLAEAFGVISYMLFAWMTQDISPKYPYKPPRQGRTVDIFVPTYNESLEILEATLIGCKRITYPHTTYVLDDGHREEVRQLAQRLGCEYIARPGHEHAKAGNINYALSQTKGEFLVILDADVIPQPDYLERTLGYFEDEKLAFIQLPQEFYNLDSIQHDQETTEWHEQSLFYRVIQPGKNYSNSAFWCGSPSVVRRAALEEVGGVATETITEDIHTSVRMHSRGWKSLYLNEILAYGIAPQTVQAFLIQRLRWAQGTMQLYRSGDSPLWIKGLSPKQRISYLSSFLAYFESYQKFILLTTPIFIMVFNIYPMKVGVWSFVEHWVPYFVLNIIANQIGGRGFFRYYQTEKFNILKMVTFIQSTVIFFRKKPLAFKVTPKTFDHSVYRQERRMMRSYMVIFGCLAGTMLFGLFKMVIREVGSLQGDVFFIALFWGAYNAMLIFSGILEVLRKHHERQQYRFPVKQAGEIRSLAATPQSLRVFVENLSITGAGFSLKDHTLRENSKIELRFSTPHESVIELPLGKIHRQFKDKNNLVHVGASFDNLDNLAREKLFAYLFIELPRRHTHLRDVKAATSPRTLKQRLSRGMLGLMGLIQIIK